MGALFDFKCAYNYTLVFVCHADAEKCIFVKTILSQTPQQNPQLTMMPVGFQLKFLTVPHRTENAEKTRLSG